MIYAFTGKMGSGKSTAAAYLASKSALWHKLKFAQPLYDMQEYIYSRIHKDQPKYKDRKLLQFLGGTWGRELDHSLWADLWELEYRHGRFFGMRGADVFTDDLRYNNEAAMLQKYKAKIILVVASRENRGKRIELSGESDAGEAGIYPRFLTDVVYNNGTTEELYEQLDDIYEVPDSHNKG